MPGDERYRDLKVSARRNRWPLLGALIAALVVLPAPAHAAFPGANGRIVFSSAVNPGSGQPETYVGTMNPDGTNEAQLTDGSTPDFNPAWSPDGTKIVFERVPGYNGTEQSFLASEIWVMDADGSGETKLTNNTTKDVDSAWSPKGDKIVFSSNRDGGPDQLYTMNADGSGQTRLTIGTEGDGEPAWSPDGQKIAFRRGIEIYVINADGLGVPTAISHPQIDSYDFNPNWSPDGLKIVIERVRTPAEAYFTNIVVMNPDGSAQNPIYRGTQYEWPVWSPEGRKLATSDQDGIYLLNPDGSGEVKISPTNRFNPDWQPLTVPEYPHPQSASQLNVSIVPAFKPCGTGGNPSNAKHAPPLGTDSCNPPRPGSVLATVGVTSQSSAQMTVVPGDTDPTNGNQANVSLTASLTDIQSAAGGDYNPNASGADLTAVTRLRFTDKANGYGGLSATATEYDFRVPIDCSSTSDLSVGSTCSVNTTANVLVPGLIQEQRQTVVQAFRVRIDDSGANGIRGDSDDRIFATQGVFVP